MPTGFAGLKPTGAMYRLYQNAASCSAKLAKGLVIFTWTVSLSSALVFLRSIGPRPNFPVKSLLYTRWNVKMTSSAVKALPSWKVTPGRSRMIQLDSDPCGVIDSASTYSTCAWASSWARGW